MSLLDVPDPDFARAVGISAPASPERTEYRRIVPHILDLCRDFGLSVDMVRELNLDTLMRSFECLDRYYDAISDEREAEAFLEDVFLFLRSSHSVRPIRSLQLPAELMQHLVVLRDVLLQTGTLNLFFNSASRICQISRDARKVHDIREYVRCSLIQGELTGKFVLEVLDFDYRPENFDHFMTYVAATGKLFDDYRDAQADYHSGQIAIKPGFIFKNYIRILLMERVAWIVAHHPNKTRALHDSSDILRSV